MQAKQFRMEFDKIVVFCVYLPYVMGYFGRCAYISIYMASHLMLLRLSLSRYIMFTLVLSAPVSLTWGLDYMCGRVALSCIDCTLCRYIGNICVYVCNMCM